MFAQYTSSKYPDFYKLNTKINKLGINTNASVDSSITDYYMEGQSIHFDFMLDVLYNTYIDFKLDTKHLEQERSSVIEELNINLNKFRFSFFVKLIHFLSNIFVCYIVIF